MSSSFVVAASSALFLALFLLATPPGRVLYRMLIGWRLSPLRRRKRRRRNGDDDNDGGGPQRGVPTVPPPSLLFGHQLEILRRPFMVPAREWLDALSEETAAAEEGGGRKSWPKMFLYYTFGMRESLMLVHPDSCRALLRRGRIRGRGIGTGTGDSVLGGGGGAGGGGGGSSANGSSNGHAGGSPSKTAAAAARAYSATPEEADAAAGLPKNLPIVQSYIGNGLVTLNGSEWHRHRTLIQPGFATHYVRTLLEGAVPPLVENLCRSWEKLPRGTPIYMQDHLQSVTLDAIGRAGFGHEFGMTEELVRWAELVRDMYSTRALDEDGSVRPIRHDDLPPREAQTHPIVSAFSAEGMRVIRPTLGELALGRCYTLFASTLLPRSTPYKRARVIRATDEGIEEIIREQRERCQASEAKLEAKIRRRSTGHGSAGGSSDGDGDGSSDSHSDDQRQQQQQRTAKAAAMSESKILKSVRKTPRSILEILLSEFSGLTDAELRDEVKTFVFAGAETTSTAVNLSLFAMCADPSGTGRGEEIQRLLHEDVCRHWPDSSVPPTADQLNRMEYLHAVLRESLRMYPPVGMIFRINDRPLSDFGGAGPVPAGTRLVLSIYLLHRNPDVWGERADEFIPERWLSDSATRAAVPGGGVDAAPSDPFAFVPFSGGGRQCIGKGFAMLEAKIVLATIVRRFRFRLAEELRGREFVLTSFITMRPKPCFLVEAEPRKE